MCMGCASNADFIVTSGILGGASLRVAARRFLPTTPRWARRVSDGEAQAFVAGLQAADPEPGGAGDPIGCWPNGADVDASANVVADPLVDERSPGRVLAGR
jgi:hypothetical protein